MARRQPVANLFNAAHSMAPDGTECSASNKGDKSLLLSLSVAQTTRFN